MRTARPLYRAALLSALLALPAVSFAQYRPPPMTEAQRLATQGDAPRVEGSRLLSQGDKKGAAAQFKKAYGYYEQALKLEPTLLTAAEGLGVVGNTLGAHDQVIQYLQPAAAANPEALDLAFNLGVAYFKTRRYPQAIPLLEQVRKGQKREHLIAHYYLAQFHLATERGDLAEVALRSYLQVRPDSVAGNDHEIHLMLGRAYVQQRKPVQARASFDLAQKGRPEDVNVQIGLANVLDLEGKRSQAVEKLEGLAQRNPTHAEAKERLARLLLEEGKLPRAEVVAKDLLALGANSTAHLLLADVHLAQKRYGEAEQQASRALTASPGYTLAQLRLGAAQQAQGKHEEALKNFEAAVAGSGGSFDALAALGSGNRRAGRFQKAIEVHRKALELAPSFPKSHLLLGADYFAAGDWDRAIQHYETALQLVPGDKKATHWLAASYARRGKARAAQPNRLEDAVRDLRRAYDLEPNATQARAYAAALLDNKAPEEAVRILSATQKLKDATWQNAWLRGYAHLAARQGEEAVQAFNAAAGLASSGEDKAQVSAGLALALAETGKVDQAVVTLERSNVSDALAANLPILLYRRALVRLDKGEVSGARDDVTAADKLRGDHEHRATFAALARALVDVEEGKDSEAAAKLRAAKVDKAPWLSAGAAPLLTAYQHYRADRFPQATRAAAPHARKAGAAGKFASALVRSVSRREAEKRFAAGQLKPAAAALRTALKAEPGSAVLAVNNACLEYAGGKAAGMKSARTTWAKHKDAVPEAGLNLGIDALAQGEVASAVELFEQYARSGRGRAGQVKEWAERLRTLYGVGGRAAVVSDGVTQ